MDFKQILYRFIFPASARTSLAKHPAIIMPAQANDASSTDRIVSYLDLEKLIDDACQDYIDAGATAGSCIVLCNANGPETVAGIFACWRLSLIAIPVDFRLTDGELLNVCTKIGAKALVTSRALAAAGGNAEANSPSVRTIDPNHWSKKLPKTDTEDSQGQTLHDLTPNLQLNLKAPGLAILTSGTTGDPKAAVHDLESLLLNIDDLTIPARVNANTRAVLPLPVSHIFGLESLLVIMLGGGTIIFEDFNPASFLNHATRLKPNMLVAVPTIYGALLQPAFDIKHLGSFNLFMCGGAALSDTLVDMFKAKFGHGIIQGYGATEAKIICVNGDGPPEAAGKPLASVKIEIVDEDDKVLDGDESIGEIRVSGPSLMIGYLGQPEMTSVVLHDGHYHTGDIGYVKDGNVFICGRSKEMINVAGNKVFPAEVEAVLLQHELVAEVAVVGKAHSKLGQVVRAVIVLPDCELSKQLEDSDEGKKQARQTLIAQMREFCQAHLKRELRPMEWDFRPCTQPLPKTRTGKIDKKVLA